MIMVVGSPIVAATKIKVDRRKGELERTVWRVMVGGGEGLN